MWNRLPWGCLPVFFASLCKELPSLPPSTAHGALIGHLTGTNPAHFQPSNVNFGLFPPLGKKIRKRERGEYLARLALEYIENWKRKNKYHF